MKRVDVHSENGFSEKNFTNLLVHDSPYSKILNFNFKAGQELPIHSHDIEGKVSIAVLEGDGESWQKTARFSRHTSATFSSRTSASRTESAQKRICVSW